MLDSPIQERAEYKGKKIPFSKETLETVSACREIHYKAMIRPPEVKGVWQEKEGY